MVKVNSVDRFLSFILFFILWFFWVFNGWNGDKEAYELYFYERELIDWNGELVYGLLNIFFRKLGLSYEIFVSFVALFVLYSFYRFFAKYAIKTTPLVVFYMFFMFSLDYVLIRNTFAFCVVLYGFDYLIKGGQGRFVYLCFVILSSLVHKMMLCFALFAFIPLDRLFRIKDFFYNGVIGLVIYFILTSGFFDSNGHLSYYNNYSMIGGVFIAFVTACVFFLFYFSVLISRPDDRVYTNKALNKAYVFYINMNFYSLSFLPLYLESEIFIRLLRWVVFLNTCFLFSMCRWNKFNYFYCLLVVVFISTFLFSYFIMPYFHYTVGPLFLNNIIFGDSR